MPVSTDVALVKNNACVGSVIAVRLAAEMKKHLTTIEPRRACTITQQSSDEEARKTSRAKASGNIVSFYYL